MRNSAHDWPQTALDALRLDYDADVPRYVQLADELLRAIVLLGGQNGMQLPSVRQTASHLHLNGNTVRIAYQRLQALGCVAIAHGNGAHVHDAAVARSCFAAIVRRRLSAAIADEIALGTPRAVLRTIIQGASA